MPSVQNLVVRSVLRAAQTGRRLFLREPLPLSLLRAISGQLARLGRAPRGVSLQRVRLRGVAAVWAVPAAPETAGVVLYLHGGAYVSGSPDTHRGLIGAIAKLTRTKTLAVDYRLAPEHPFPAALDDVEKVYLSLIESGVDPRAIVLAGDSSGGGLSIATMLRLRDKNLPLPAAAACMSPWLDLEGIGPSVLELQKKDPIVPLDALRAYGHQYADKDSIRHPYVAPIYASLKGLPPILLQVSDSEILLDDSERFAKKARAEGVDVELDIWKKTVHCWQIIGPLLPEAKEAVASLSKFIRSKIPPSSSPPSK